MAECKFERFFMLLDRVFLTLDLASLDYSRTLMAASGEASERALPSTMQEDFGKYLLLVTGSVPLNDNGIHPTAAGPRREQGG